ncbi:Flp pilus assembly pilin Flp [Rhodoblastus sphagnicola]|uniref:hypothetical protein n=1 Tax=Rhodoblastus sphagnicola TaxID=333368 RepID=UPI001304E6E5|nr:hypothetical protein [Rhodoblastus sphagnicola]MBB4196481.1 Flp pilus assembly pilin Flp [Rhodoblastus sphagnicola]
MVVAFSRILRRQAGATVKELAVMAGLIGFSLASMVGVVGYGVYATSMAVSQR